MSLWSAGAGIILAKSGNIDIFRRNLVCAEEKRNVDAGRFLVKGGAGFGGQQAGGAAGGSGNKGPDDVVDADYTVVDDQ